ncbi:MAG TPA: substrate-binding domain-containing protein [Candidatus Binataceae bacterium]|nr:substrate-binding domain-containing protein [Candidatus Binataceae bacterium]
MAGQIEERLRALRNARKLSQVELARRVRISRQALGAIESGLYQPGVAVAIRLAQELGESVESLFGDADDNRPLIAQCAAAEARAPHTRVALARLGGRLVAMAVPASALALHPAGGLVTQSLRGKRVEVAALRSSAEIDLTVVIAGCDPAVALLGDYLARRQPRIEVAALAQSSRDALTTAASGGAHAAGVHLRDPGSDDYNIAAARRAFAAKPFRVVNFARWELGLASRPSGPRIDRLEQLTHKGTRLINRERGAGARAALDEALAGDGLKPADITGYDRFAAGHLEVAAAIAEGSADAGVTLRFAAEVLGLAFQPWREERYDLIIPAAEFDSAPVRGLLDALNSARLAREITALCAYDTSQMGRVDAPFA